MRLSRPKPGKNRMAIPRGGWAVAALAGIVLTAGAACAGDWMKIYNGKDLSGWHAHQGKIEVWSANGDMITCTGKSGGYLASDREYGDFDLKVDYRITRAGNSGIGLRFPRDGWPSTDGMEIQILDDAAPEYKGLHPESRNGSIYTFVAPKAHPEKPVGEWNHMEIRCQGPKVVIHLNGVEIQNVNLDDYLDARGKGKLPLGRRPRKGLIGLQSHTDRVDFRNIEIREL